MGWGGAGKRGGGDAGGGERRCHSCKQVRAQLTVVGGLGQRTEMEISQAAAAAVAAASAAATDGEMVTIDGKRHTIFQQFLP